MAMKARLSSVRWGDDERKSAVLNVEIVDSDGASLHKQDYRVPAHVLNGFSSVADFRAWMAGWVRSRIQSYKLESQTLSQAKMDRLQSLEGEEVTE